ncbi:MAG: ATP-binding protein [Nocardiopsaceae bacterium]|nr:ATP-binding protein [Nocardiopsaceae bacterium]
MLLSFRVSNFLSIREEQEFSFLASSAPSRSRPDEGEGWAEDVGTLAGIFGANASGKSNVLKALDFMRDAVMSSYAAWAAKDAIPVTPFALDAPSKDEPSLFEAVFQLDGVRYQYGFRLTRREVVGEWLYAYVTHRRQVWFERDVSSPDAWYFGKSFTGRNKVIADLTRPTALFLSTAAANNHRMAREADRFFRSYLTAAWPDDKDSRVRFTQGLVSDEESWAEVTDLLRFADLGIRSARVRREPSDALFTVFLLRALQQSYSSVGELVPDRGGPVDEIVEFGHSVGSEQDLVFLPLAAESLGTQAWFALIGPTLNALKAGGTLTIDEIDASLHPHLTSEILRIFSDPKRNPKQAQLLFTSHDTTLMGGMLGGRELTRDQIWFTEKKSDGATVLYPLTDFSPRKTENLERGYLQGRYGAIPFLEGQVLEEIAERIDPGEDEGR